MKKLLAGLLGSASLFALSLISGEPLPAVASDYMCIPLSASGAQSRNITNPATGNSYALNGRGCANIATNDVRYFVSQGFIDYSTAGPTGGAVTGNVFSSGLEVTGTNPTLFFGHHTGLSVYDDGVAQSLNVPFSAFSSEAYNPGAGTFYQPFIFQHNVTCTTDECGERNSLVMQTNVTGSRVGQFMNAFQPNMFVLSGNGQASAENPYILACNASGTGPCAGAAGVTNGTGEFVGSEIDTDIRVASVVRKIALQLASVATDVGAGSSASLDSALHVGNQNGGVGYNSGISFGENSNNFGVWGSYLYAKNIGRNPHNYINFPNFAVGGTGIISGTSLTLTGDITAAGATLSAPLFVNSDFRVYNAGLMYWQARSVMQSPADGVIELTNQAINGFTRLQLGGTTASFPAIKRNTTALNFRLADDSADAAITAAGADFSGAVTVGSDFRVYNAGLMYWQNRSVMQSPADGVIELTNQAINNFTRLDLGGTTASFPAIKRNGAAINFRLADDSDDATITAGNVGFGGAAATGPFQVKVAADQLVRIITSIGYGEIDSTNLAQSAYSPLGLNGSILSLGSAGVQQMFMSNGSPIVFATKSQWTDNGAVATVLGGTGPVGAHTTPQTWLTVLDSAGVTRFIPAF